ncbi:hypothetical protein HNR09_000912 [Nesterenkonia xinjiangensis]|uniref:Uncharacterized protein n=1 Tax=Nesterenkonia xinjiangensis TaxID=225327 RepID=A0A7Z0GK56_9MICC|nr:hypothetical protein [Nesterenkonia xinjiangensis]
MESIHLCGMVLCLLSPPGGVCPHRTHRGCDLKVEGLRNRALELAQHGLLAGRRRGGAQGGEERMSLRRRQSGQIRAGTPDQSPAPATSGLGVDGHTGRAEGLEVTAGRGYGDVQLVGDLPCGRPLPGLEDEEDRDEAVGAHGESVARKVLIP